MSLCTWGRKWADKCREEIGKRHRPSALPPGLAAMGSGVRRDSLPAGGKAGGNSVGKGSPVLRAEGEKHLCALGCPLTALLGRNADPQSLCRFKIWLNGKNMVDGPARK